jgi:hypothetical protein
VPFDLGGDHPPVEEPDDDLAGGGFELELPDIPTEAGWVPWGGQSVAEVKEDLRTRNAAAAKRLVDLTGWSHGRVNGEMNRRAAITSVGSATVPQLERRLREAERWLEQLRARRR